MTARDIVGEAVKAAAIEAAREVAAEGVQTSMFPVPLRAAHREYLQRDLERRHRPGRPAGAENWSNKQLREYLLRRGKHPLANLMEWSLHTPTTLAAELGCTRLEALRELRQVWEALAPFFAGKVGPVDDDGRPVPFLHVSVAGGNVQIHDGSTPWDQRERLAKRLKEDQGLSVEGALVSHAWKSHEEDK